MPKGYPKKHPNGAAKELESIEAKIAELKQRQKDIMSRGSQRKRLIDYCSRHELTRADLYAAAAQLPLLRITRKSREKQAKERST